MPKFPPLCSDEDFLGVISKNQGAKVSPHGRGTGVTAVPLPALSVMGGWGVPNPPPLPAELCVSLNNYSDESITIRPNSHSAELTQIILILCFYR